jgi:hypothetical protein
MFRHVLTSASGILPSDAAFKRGKLTRLGKRLLPRIVGEDAILCVSQTAEVAQTTCADLNAVTPVSRFPNEITNGRQEGGMLKRLPALLVLPALMVYCRHNCAPQVAYSFVPNGIMEYAAFMYQIGRTKRRPEKWSDLFFPEIHDRPGS